MSAAAGRTRVLVLGALLLCVATVLALLLVQGGGGARQAAPTQVPTDSATQAVTQVAHTPVSGLPTVAESALPPEAWETMRRIADGGPFSYRQDDATFFNREGILPERRRGYYREYTVETPGSPDRGARRIVAGAEGDLFYTEDHYDSFRQIEEDT
mgnify:CR=1 FL=1